MAGHPVVGTWHVLALRGVVLPPASGAGTVTVQQELGVGILPVAIEFASGAPVNSNVEPVEKGRAEIFTRKTTSVFGV